MRRVKKDWEKKGTYIMLTVPALTADDKVGLAYMSRVLIEELDEMLSECLNMKKGKYLFQRPR